MIDLQLFQTQIRQSYPALHRSLEEVITAGGERIKSLADRILRNYGSLFPTEPERLGRAYAALVIEINRLQLKYEMTGHYAESEYSRALDRVYRNEQRMTDYMLGVACTQFAWPNHFELFCFFEDRFVKRVRATNVLEIAPGHGLLGLTLLEHNASSQLTGIDISPASVHISRMIAAQFGQRRARYIEGDALGLPGDFYGRFDVVICGELMEHLPAPPMLCRNIAKAMTPDGYAYVTAAITAEAPDHIYEFTTEEEVIALYEEAGLKVVERLCAGTRALTECAKGAPRVLATVLRRK